WRNRLGKSEIVVFQAQPGDWSYGKEGSNMATNVRFKPGVIDFRAVRPHSASEWAEGVYAVAPTTATVTPTIVGDREHFQVEGMYSYLTVKRPFTAQELEELRPLERPQAALRTIVEDVPMGESKGESPLTVQAHEK